MWLARRLDGSDQIDVWEIDPLEVIPGKGGRPCDNKIVKRKPKVWRFGTAVPGHPVLCKPGIACIARTKSAAVSGAFWAEAA